MTLNQLLHYDNRNTHYLLGLWGRCNDSHVLLNLCHPVYCMVLITISFLSHFGNLVAVVKEFWTINFAGVLRVNRNSRSSSEITRTVSRTQIPDDDNAMLFITSNMHDIDKLGSLCILNSSECGITCCYQNKIGDETQMQTWKRNLCSHWKNYIWQERTPLSLAKSTASSTVFFMEYIMCCNIGIPEKGSCYDVK